MIIAGVGLAGCAVLQPKPRPPPDGAVTIAATRSYVSKLGTVSGGNGHAQSTACDGGTCEFNGRFSVAIRPLRFRDRTTTDGTLVITLPSGERRADGSVVLDVTAAQAELCAKFGRSPRKCTPMKVTRARAKIAGADVEVHALLTDATDGRIEAHLIASATEKK